MTSQQAKEIFNQAHKAALEVGDDGAAANIELCREFFTNSEFRKAMSDYVWEINSSRG